MLVLSWSVGLGVFLCSIAPKTSDRFPLAFAVPMVIVLGPLLNYALVFASGALTTWTGRALGGHGTAVQLRAAVAWAQAPLLLCLVLWLPEALGSGVWRFAADATEWSVILWSEALAVVLVAEVHGFSIGRAILAALLAWALKLILVFGLVFAIASGAESPPPRDSAPAPSPATSVAP